MSDDHLNGVKSDPDPAVTEAIAKPAKSQPPVPDVVEQKLNEALEGLPEPNRERVRESVHEMFMAIVQRGTAPTIDADTAKILAASADKEHEYRFKFRTQQQKDSAEESAREHEFERIRHKDRLKIFVPILITVLIAVVGCLTVGIYLAATGQELLGTGLITGTSFAVAGYLSGVGTAGFFKDTD
ncbi:MAG TPA: hypothetical protein VI306_07515 [Pyrinomonadaceae bacterium]